MLLHRLLAYATLRRNPISSLLKSEPTVLVRDGVVDAHALAREGISHDDLLEELRLKQVGQVEDARLATLERSGKISVISRKPA